MWLTTSSEQCTIGGSEGKDFPKMREKRKRGLTFTFARLKTYAITKSGESMKGSRERLPSRNRRILSACLAVSALSVALHASAAVTTLTSQNSTMNFDFGSSAGLTDWLVDGTDQANQQWFWYRIGSGGPQSDLSLISSPVITPNINGRQLRVLYANSS